MTTDHARPTRRLPDPAAPVDLREAPGAPQRAGIPRTAPVVPHSPWHRGYRRVVLALDTVLLAAAAGLSLAVEAGVASVERTDVVLAAVLAIASWLVLHAVGATDVRVLGDGIAEYQRVLRAALTTFGLVGAGVLVLEVEVSRTVVLVAAAAGLVLVTAGRKLLRTWLARRREHGALHTNVVVIGSVAAARSICEHLSENRSAGLRVTGVWVAGQVDLPQQTLTVGGTTAPVLDGTADLGRVLDVTAAGMVVVSDAQHLGHRGLRELAWALHDRGVELMVSPHVMDVATERVSLRSVGTMSMLHLEEPQFEGARRWEKAVFDRVLAAVALVALAPLLVVVGLGVRLTSRGPALYRSERMGLDGEPFQMLKFRSMVDGADRQRAALRSDGEGILFKMRDDPRVTPLGRLLRRYSLDELPQLVNVLRGDMSIVGPRPPLRGEVDQYDERARRRLLVRQGITGLWQVSGRSDLSWEDTVRLDVDYVENWSLLRDVQIIWRTVQAVLRPSGAY